MKPPGHDGQSGGSVGDEDRGMHKTPKAPKTQRDAHHMVGRNIRKVSSLTVSTGISICHMHEGRFRRSVSRGNAFIRMNRPTQTPAEGKQFR